MSTTRPVYMLADRYRLDDLIATGGMGEVWRATDLALGRPVAVKLLRAEYVQHPETLTRFRAEARHAGSLSHQHIARIYDYGEADATHPPFLVMELVDGPPLTRLLASGPMQPARVMDVVAQAADGLAAAHAAGLVHRDIKPGNLLLAPPDQVKITDFGIAYAAGSAPITRTGMLIGTPAYVAPERVTGAGATPASDLYSLGIVAYECLAGALPFSGTAMEVALSHQMRALPPLPAAVPAEVGALVAELTAKDPAARPASAREVVTRAGRLRDALSGAPAAGAAFPSAGPVFWPAPPSVEADAGPGAPSAGPGERPAPPPSAADAWPGAPSAGPGERTASPPAGASVPPGAPPAGAGREGAAPAAWPAAPAARAGREGAAPAAWPAAAAAGTDAWPTQPSPDAGTRRASSSAEPGAWPASPPASAADAQADTLAGPQATLREIGPPGPARPARHRPVPRGGGRRGRVIVLAVAAVAVAALAGWALAGLSGGTSAHGRPAAPSSSTPHTRPATSPVTRTVQVNPGALIGQPVRVVTQRLRQLGLRARVKFTRTGSRPPGTVLFVRPTGQVAAGSSVTVTAALPPPGRGHGHGHGHGDGGGNGQGNG
jgi:eukaryotic-like serine/threonine-protein kinase